MLGLALMVTGVGKGDLAFPSVGAEIPKLTHAERTVIAANAIPA
jgi:hypothetical protein